MSGISWGFWPPMTPFKAPKPAAQSPVNTGSKGARPRAKRARGQYHKSNLFAAKRAIERKGLAAYDGRSKESRFLRALREKLREALGGDPSPQQLLIIEMLIRQVAILSVGHTWSQANEGALINKRKKAFAPIVLEMLRISGSIASHLQALGLERKAKPVVTLAEIMKSKEQA